MPAAPASFPQHLQDGAPVTLMNRNGAKLPHLFSLWPSVANRLHRARHILLFLDFDGTLVGFKPRPEDVTLPGVARIVLAHLARLPRLKVFLISGRRRADLRRRARVPGVGYIGLHGWERNGRRSLSAESRNSLRSVRSILAVALEKLPGVWIEDKKPAFVVHYRTASAADARTAVAITIRHVDSWRNNLYCVKGNKVVDVLPFEIEGKGQAVGDLVRDQPPGTLVIYAGDDTTDETAFAALARRGVTILVGPRRKTKARYRLRNPRELTFFLQKLQENLTGGVAPAS